MYKKILFAVDFDAVGIHAAKKARKIADENHADLHIIHVIEPIPAYAYPGFAGFTEIELPIRERAEEELKKIATQLKVNDEHIHLELGSTKHEVLRVAEELKVDLIIAGSHGKHGLMLLMGSTANAIMHGAECDVLIVRGEH